MGKSPKPLSILIHPDIAEWECWQGFRDQGYTIEVMENPKAYDLIMGPNAWQMREGLNKYVKIAIEEGRKVRYPNRKGSD